MRRTVHHIGQDQPMPVHSSRFGQPVGHVDSHPIAFAKAQRRAWHLAIEGISVDVDVWQYLPADHRCLQIEHLDAIFQARLELRPPRTFSPYVCVTSRGSTAAMSSIAAAGVSLSMIIPGGMIAPPTSCALKVRL